VFAVGFEGRSALLKPDLTKRALNRHLIQRAENSSSVNSEPQPMTELTDGLVRFAAPKTFRDCPDSLEIVSIPMRVVIFGAAGRW